MCFWKNMLSPKNLFFKYQTIAKNTAYMTILEIIRVAMPFLALPYIVATAGRHNYGLVIFFQSIVSYFQFFISYGFDISAVKDIAEARDKPRQVSEIVSTVYVVKILLFIVSILIYVSIPLFLPQARENLFLFYITFSVCIYDLLLPLWYYQAVEKMGYLTLTQSGSLILYTILIFLFFKKPEQVYFIPLFQSLSYLVFGLYTFILMLTKEKVRFIMPSRKAVFAQIKYSWAFFLSRVAGLFNVNIANIISGLFLSMESVAAFSLALKIAQVGLLPMRMLNRALFPHLSRTKDRPMIKKLFKLNILFSFIICLGLYILAPWGVAILGKGTLPEATEVLRLLLLFIFIGNISSFTGTPVLVSFGYPRPYTNSVYFSTLVLCALYVLIWLTGWYSLASFALALGASEVAMFIYRYIASKKYKLL